MVQILLSLLLATAILQAQELSSQETAALLTRFTDLRKGAAMQADFRDEKHLAIMKKPVIETGTVALLPPGNFRREVKGKSLTVCDGTTLWLYYPEFHEAEKYLLASSRALRESLVAITSGISLQDLAKNFGVKASKQSDGFLLTLTPKTAALRKSVSQVSVEISPELAARRLEISGIGGDRTITTFSNERKASLTTADFQFQPPKGTTVSEPLK